MGVALVTGEARAGAVAGLTILPAERARLVRLCALLTGDRQAAEDLAQETLYEAWRHADGMRDPERQRQWLSGIARNICRRWLRSAGRESARLVPLGTGSDRADEAAAAWPGQADDGDLVVALERDELATLLDRALALLPAETRAILLERYIHESPHAEIAARLGLTEGAVKVRAQRGRVALRRLLNTDLRADAATFGLVTAPPDAWQQTRLWCPDCGQRQLVGRFSRGPGGVCQLRCPECHAAPGAYFTNTRCDSFARGLLGEVKAYRPALNRIMAWADAYFQRGLAERTVPCPECGRALPLHLRMSAFDPPSLQGIRGVHASCPACGFRTSQGLGNIVLALPEARRFWREHRRVRLLPPREVVVAGTGALVRRLESVADRAALEVLVDRQTYRVLAIYPDQRG